MPNPTPEIKSSATYIHDREPHQDALLAIDVFAHPLIIKSFIPRNHARHPGAGGTPDPPYAVPCCPYPP